MFWIIGFFFFGVVGEFFDILCWFGEVFRVIILWMCFVFLFDVSGVYVFEEFVE